jgi:hypothetical protein
LTTLGVFGLIAFQRAEICKRLFELALFGLTLLRAKMQTTRIFAGVELAGKRAVTFVEARALSFVALRWGEAVAAQPTQRFDKLV